MQEEKIKKYLLIGLIASVIIVCGEMIGAYAPSTDTGAVGVIQMIDWYTAFSGTDKMNEMLANYLYCFENLAVWQTGMGALIGGIGILANYLGLYGLYLTFDNKESRLAKAYCIGSIGYNFGGCIVHIAMCMMMYVLKMNLQDANGWAVIGEFALWYAAPITVIFFVFYGITCVTMFLQFFKKHTPFPKWCCLLNPMLGKVVFNTLAKMIPPSPFANAVANANMGLTSVVIFIVLVALYKKEKS